MLSTTRQQAIRWLSKALALALLVAVVGCDSNSDEDEDDINGLWQSRGDDVLYIDINTGDREITVYDYLGDAFDDLADCYVIYTIDILEIDGDMYTLAGEGEVRFEADGDVLTTTATDLSGGSESIVRFDRSDRSASQLRPECDFEEENTLRSPPQRLDKQRL